MTHTERVREVVTTLMASRPGVQWDVRVDKLGVLVTMSKGGVHHAEIMQRSWGPKRIVVEVERLAARAETPRGDR